MERSCQPAQGLYRIEVNNIKTCENSYKVNFRNNAANPRKQITPKLFRIFIMSRSASAFQELAVNVMYTRMNKTIATIY